MLHLLFSHFSLALYILDPGENVQTEGFLNSPHKLNCFCLPSSIFPKSTFSVYLGQMPFYTILGAEYNSRWCEGMFVMLCTLCVRLWCEPTLHGSSALDAKVLQSEQTLKCSWRDVGEMCCCNPGKRVRQKTLYIRSVSRARSKRGVR